MFCGNNIQCVCAYQCPPRAGAAEAETAAESTKYVKYAPQARHLYWSPSEKLAYTHGRPLDVNILVPLEPTPLHLQAVRLMAGTSTHSDRKSVV